MTTLWQYLWPAFGAGAVIGLVAGLVGFRSRSHRTISLAVGLGMALATAAVWHGPFGAADRLSSQIGRRIQLTLNYYEMTQVHAALGRDPLTRHISLRGPADDFQRTELVRLMNDIPGVSGTSWGDGQAAIPLLAEGLGASLLGFLLGLLLAYGVESRRRYNAQWNW